MFWPTPADEKKLATSGRYKGAYRGRVVSAGGQPVTGEIKVMVGVGLYRPNGWVSACSGQSGQRRVQKERNAPQGRDSVEREHEPPERRPLIPVGTVGIEHDLTS